MTRPIRTAYDPAAIPCRSLDWTAWLDGREELATGGGPTEAAAVADLLEQIGEAA